VSIDLSPAETTFPQPLAPLYLSAMAMTWDSPLVSALAGELQNRLRGDRLRAHEFRWDERELLLYFRGCTLRWALHPSKGWLTLEDPTEPPPGARPLTAHLLRIQAPRDERTLEFHLGRPRGKVRAIRVVAELMTNQWNALLLEGEELRIRHLLWTRNLDDRPLVVGRLYRPPEPSTRLGIDPPLSLPEWQEIMETREGEELRAYLLAKVAFTSPLNLPGLLPDPSRPDPSALDKAPSDGGPSGGPPLEGYPLWEELRTPATLHPCLLELGRNKQPYPFIIKGFGYTPFSDLLSAIEAVSGAESDGGDRTDEIEQEVDRALHRARKKVSGLQKEMDQAEDPEVPREAANLLLARMHLVSRGTASITLEGFAGEPVELSLDPALNARENAAALYAEAARRERAKVRLPALLEEAKGREKGLESLREGLRSGTVSPEEAQRHLPGALKKAPGRKQGERLPYKVFRSSGGLEIRVGRGSKENDALTFRHSNSLDVWLHARDSSGAHVVLRWGRDETPPRRDLEEAAILAALHSGSRGSATVPVDWTFRKYVRKARKSPPGTVIPREVQTLFVEPDPGLPDRLKEPDPSPL
jgi:predicted ribosome quality control (RQC) complex YloA/Tae2 family protein